MTQNPDLLIDIPARPEWVTRAEKHYGSTYIGYYDLPDREGPFYVFYQPNPKTELGHSHYFGLFQRPASPDPLGPWNTFITQAKSIVDAKFPAIHYPDGSILCSRFRHDYVTKGDDMLDGGLAYTRSSGQGPNGYIAIVGDKEVFTPYETGSQ